MKQRIDTMKGDRVLLRPLLESDLEESLRVWTPEPRHMYGGSLVSEHRPTVEDKRRWFERVQRGELGHVFAIEAGGSYIGHARITVTDEKNQRAHYAVGIENPAYWGRGYGTEVTRLMLRHAFETLDLHRVEVRAAAYNTRAIRCYEKCGFRHEGVERDSFFVDDKWHDDLLMAVLRPDWQNALCAPSDGICELGPEQAAEVIALWEQAGLWPHATEDVGTVETALTRNRDFACGWLESGKLVATAIGAWDGFRGWIYRVAVLPAYRRQGIASALVREVERRLVACGARQINLMIGLDYRAARALYSRLGYEISWAQLMRKRFADAREKDR